MLTEAQRHEAYQAYFDRYGLARHQVESYNHFVDTLLPRIVKEYGVRVVASAKHGFTHVVRFVNLTVPKPMDTTSAGVTKKLTAARARLVGLTYAAPVLVDVVHEIYTTDEEVIKANEERIQEAENAGLSVSEEMQYGTLLSRNEYREVTLFELPVMVGSCLCHTLDDPDPALTQECILDHGGFFVINGNEKVVVAQETMRPNYPMITLRNEGRDVHCEFRSWHEERIRSTSTLFFSLAHNKGSTMPELTVRVPFVTMPIPVAWLFRIMGLETETEMRRTVTGCTRETGDSELDHTVKCIFRDSGTDMTVEEICDFIGQRGTTQKTTEARIHTVMGVVQNEFLPHMGLEKTQATLDKRVRFLGYLVRRLVMVYLGREPPDSRDNYANKRLQTTGMLLATQLRQQVRVYMRALETDLKKAIDSKRYVTVLELMSSHKITTGLRYALSTGNWGTQKGGSTQTGVAQVLARMIPMAMLSHLRRVNTPANHKGKAAERRQLEESQRGILCPCETPEGEACGLVSNLAVLAHVRIGYPSAPVTSLVMDVVDDHRDRLVQPLLECPYESIGVSATVIVNGALVGYSASPDALVHALHSYRQSGELPFDATVVHYRARKEVVVYTDEGCCMQPLWRLDKTDLYDQAKRDCYSNSYMLWDSLVQYGVLEYIDKEEERTVGVADTVEEGVHDSDRYTHAKVDPTADTGVSASVIPFPEHNQAPRNMYQSAMGKQAIGMTTTNSHLRFDTKFHTLVHPERPLVTTRFTEAVGLDAAPSGQNLYVCIGSALGYNMEDSSVIKKSSLDMMMGASMMYQTYKEGEKNKGADRETIERPDPGEVSGMQDGDYSKIGPDGLCPVGTVLDDLDVIIGKVMETGALQKKSRDDNIRRDRSVRLKNKERCTVDSVVQISSRTQDVVEQPTADDTRSVRVRTRALRIPEVGDKFSSRHGQKGVCARIVPDEDMPVDEDGVSPDIIINPHCIPSRMTIAHLMEMAAGTAAAMAGRFVDGTPFRHTTVEQINEELIKAGCAPLCEKTFIDGRTGERIKNTMFAGIIFYQRLKHMVADKVHGRARGPKTAITRQPTEGRRKDGGLRFGEMERDNLGCQGAADMARDRLFEQSDKFETVVCNTCGFFAEWTDASGRDKLYSHVVDRQDFAYCRYCDSHENIQRIHMPYAKTLLIRELEASGIAVRVRVGEDENDLVIEPVHNYSMAA